MLPIPYGAHALRETPPLGNTALDSSRTSAPTPRGGTSDGTAPTSRCSSSTAAMLGTGDTTTPKNTMAPRVSCRALVGLAGFAWTPPVPNGNGCSSLSVPLACADRVLRAGALRMDTYCANVVTGIRASATRRAGTADTNCCQTMVTVAILQWEILTSLSSTTIGAADGVRTLTKRRPATKRATTWSADRGGSLSARGNGTRPIERAANKRTSTLATRTVSTIRAAIAADSTAVVSTP